MQCKVDLGARSGRAEGTYAAIRRRLQEGDAEVGSSQLRRDLAHRGYSVVELGGGRAFAAEALTAGERGGKAIREEEKRVMWELPLLSRGGKRKRRGADLLGGVAAAMDEVVRMAAEAEGVERGMLEWTWPAVIRSMEGCGQQDLHRDFSPAGMVRDL